ncbi:MAG TPA: CocE/NonD family hydrolase C-terminal non-catalytic domain-containing protein, partial [Thermomicrobiales bacterium]|nr:CocE/NonD family hydrolase C-terminal non-catalytic domain-containing protein [Thermomicrobiales bacterium]
EETGILDDPPVRLEIRKDAKTVVAVRGIDQWPPGGLVARDLYLDAVDCSLKPSVPAKPASVAVEGKGVAFRFEHRFEETVDIVGPMWLTVYISTERDDVPVFVGVRKYVSGREVGFEGSYGFDRALVTHGWLLASHREVDDALSTEWEPYHPHKRSVPLSPGEVTRLDIGLLPSATRFDRGESLVLELRDRWFFPRNPLVGQFPAAYRGGSGARWMVHTGGAYESKLRIPMLNAPGSDTVTSAT